MIEWINRTIWKGLKTPMNELTTSFSGSKTFLRRTLCMIQVSMQFVTDVQRGSQHTWARKEGDMGDCAILLRLLVGVVLVLLVSVPHISPLSVAVTCGCSKSYRGGVTCRFRGRMENYKTGILYFSKNLFTGWNLIQFICGSCIYVLELLKVLNLIYFGI